MQELTECWVVMTKRCHIPCRYRLLKKEEEEERHIYLFMV
jgi:hypothetical protein